MKLILLETALHYDIVPRWFVKPWPSRRPEKKRGLVLSVVSFKTWGKYSKNGEECQIPNVSMSLCLEEYFDSGVDERQVKYMGREK
jgi:hypothetical protein